MAIQTTWRRALLAAALAVGGLALGACNDAATGDHGEPHAGADKGYVTEGGRFNNSQSADSFDWKAEHLGLPAGGGKDPATASREQHGGLPEGGHRASATNQDIAELRARMLEDQTAPAQVRTRNERVALGARRGTLPSATSNDTPTPQGGQQPAVGGSGQPAPAQPLQGAGQPAQGQGGVGAGATSQGQGASGVGDEGTTGGHNAGVAGGPAQTVGGAATAPRPDTTAAEPHTDEAQQVEQDKKDQDEAQQQ